MFPIMQNGEGKSFQQKIRIFHILILYSTISFVASGCLCQLRLSGHHLTMASRAWMLLFLEAEIAGVSVRAVEASAASATSKGLSRPVY